MTPKEKWDRLNNPTCLEDYGLSLSRDELIQFPEGRAIVEHLDFIAKQRSDIDSLINSIIENINQTLYDFFKKY